MIEKISTAGWDRERWQAWRRKVQTIGGSDAAAVLGLSPYKSPYALWAEKTGAVEPEDISEKEAVRLGNDLEDYVARRWSEKTGKRVRRERAILSNPEYPFAHANIDRAVVGEPDAGLECKTTSSYDIIKKLRAGELPESWYCQCMHYMMVTGAKRWYLAAVAFGAGFFHFDIPRNDAEIQALSAAEAEFCQMVTSSTPPDVDGADSTLDAIRAIFPMEDPGATVDLSGYGTDIAILSQCDRQIKELERKKSAAKARIMQYMGQAQRAASADCTVTWKTQTRSTMDIDEYEKDFGQIPEKYFKKSTSRVFKYKMTNKGE